MSEKRSNTNREENKTSAFTVIPDLMHSFLKASPVEFQEECKHILGIEKLDQVVPKVSDLLQNIEILRPSRKPEPETTVEPTS